VGHGRNQPRGHDWVPRRETFNRRGPCCPKLDLLETPALAICDKSIYILNQIH
jgi:hypothetical protein